MAEDMPKEMPEDSPEDKPEYAANHPELTVLMPCLNEAETLEVCIKKAQSYFASSGVAGEVVIADNGSDDGSQAIAERCGARVVDVPVRGYGAALITGSKAARGTYVIMGDADDSYDFLHLQPFVDKLREGYELVMGNRFKGGIAEGAMPPLHKYLGNPVLSFIGRLFFTSDIGDFHCGLRGYNNASIQALGLNTTGMEYASEMVVKATLNKLRIAEVPTTLSKDGRSRPPHLRSWSDGWRHLKFLLTHSPNWLFFYPGLVLLLLGLVVLALLIPGPLHLGSVDLDIHTMLYAAAAMILGANALIFAVFTNVYALKTGYLPPSRSTAFYERLKPEWLLVGGLLLLLAGLVVTVVAFVIWGGSGFGDLEPTQMMRMTIPALAAIVVGIEAIFAGFFVGVLKN
ncbi:MAG: glycosyltransferase family 2 protein [Coriobacteriales bacterium]|jgi:glycosyltransferase involved in cell wall biosynthesis|nr:glycosyltransferase family 2 protein [Coriobacteriales bacterium]